MTRRQRLFFTVGSLLGFGLIVWVHYTLDFPVTQYVKTTFDPSSGFISFVHIWSDFAYGWPYLVGLAILFFVAKFILHNTKVALFSAYLWLCVAISGIVCDILKLVFGRPRPSLLYAHHVHSFIFFGHRQFHASGNTSFPSGHATTAASVAIGIYLLFPRLRIPAILFMLSIAVARVLLLRHYVADVMAGMYLGAVTSYFLYKLMQRRYARVLQGVSV